MGKTGRRWTGIIGMVNRSEVDIGMSCLTVTYERSLAVDFVPYSTEATAFVTHLAYTSYSANFLLDIFTLDLWLILIFILVSLPFIMIKLHKKLSYASVLLRFFGCFFKQSAAFQQSDTSTRFIMGSWILFTQFITLAYSALLLAFITIPLNPSGIKSIEELSKAISAGNFKCYTVKGASEIPFQNRLDQM